MATGAAYRLHRQCAETFGDSRLVENCHQHGRDLLRNAKHEKPGLASIFANTLRCGALEEREVPTIAASNAEKVTQGRSMFRKPVVKSMMCRGFKLPLPIQNMMLQKKADHTWPSPTPMGLFESVAATAALRNIDLSFSE